MSYMSKCANEIIVFLFLFVMRCDMEKYFLHNYVCLLIEKRMREDFLSNAHGYQKYMHNYSE